MKSKSLFVTLPLIALSITSCGERIHWSDHPEAYVYSMQYHEGFNILQLTDIHWCVNTSTTSSKQYLDKVIAEVDRKIKADDPTKKIDLVELTGDQFMVANSYHVKTFIKYFETKAAHYDFKYAVIWGNHDRQGLYSPNWLADQYRKAEHCFYIEPEDDLYGRSNFVINLTQDGGVDSQAVWQIVNLDSGASFSESPLSIARHYEYIRREQVDWWIQQHDDNPKVGNTVSTIAYYHIPQQENLEAWNKIHKEGATYKNKFFKLEGFDDANHPGCTSDLISEGRTRNLKGAFMGHAHNVDWTVDYDGVIIGLGVKTGDELYFAHIDPAKKDSDPNLKEGLESVGIDEKFDLIGASLVTIKDANSFDLEHLYLNEREGTNDFVRWVKF